MLTTTTITYCATCREPASAAGDECHGCLGEGRVWDCRHGGATRCDPDTCGPVNCPCCGGSGTERDRA